MGFDVPIGSGTSAVRALFVEGTLQIVMFGVDPPAGVAHLQGPFRPIQEGYPLIQLHLFHVSPQRAHHRKVLLWFHPLNQGPLGWLLLRYFLPGALRYHVLGGLAPITTPATLALCEGWHLNRSACSRGKWGSFWGVYHSAVGGTERGSSEGGVEPISYLLVGVSHLQPLLAPAARPLHLQYFFHRIVDCPLLVP